MYIDYYDLVDDLDPSKDRNHNYDKLLIAQNYWNRRFGPEADLMKSLTAVAMGVFADNNKYGKFRAQRAREKMESFLNGAALNKKLPTKKYDEAINRAVQLGITKQELDELINNMNITIAVLPINLMNLKRIIYIAIAVFAFLLIIIVLPFIYKNFAPSRQSEAEYLSAEVGRLMLRKDPISIEEAMEKNEKIFRLYPVPDPVFIEQAKNRHWR